MLIAFIAGDQAVAAEQTQLQSLNGTNLNGNTKDNTTPSLNTTVQQVLDALDTMYPGQVPPIHQLLYYTRYFWGQDVYTLGSYSYMANGTNGTV